MSKIIFTEEEMEKIVKSYTEDFQPTHLIAKLFNVNIKTIIRILKNKNIRIPKSSPYTYKYWEERGMKKDLIEKHLKSLRPCNKEFWMKKGYSEEESILQIEGQKLTSLRGCIARFGEKDGRIIWDSRKEKRKEIGKKSNVNIEYWLKKGYNEEESKKLVSERQSTFSLKKCVEKYGEEKGEEKWGERQNRWLKSLNKNGNLKSGYSDISQELFFKLKTEYDINDLPYILFAKNNGEFIISHNNFFYRYDFTDLKNKKIIEYNGDIYHANPSYYNENDLPHPFKKKLTAKEIWLKDENKKKLAEKNDFKIFVVWDSEYRRNKEEIFNKCLNFLKND